MKVNLFFFIYENINDLIHYFDWFDIDWNYFIISKPAKIPFFHKSFECFSHFFNLSNNWKENWLKSY